MKRALGLCVLIVGLLVGYAIWRNGRENPSASPAVISESVQAAAPSEPSAPLAPVVDPVAAPAAREQAAPVEAQVSPAKDLTPLLRVHVLAKENLTPLGSVRLLLFEADGDGRSRSGMHVESSHAKLGECPVSDETGWAEFELLESRPYRLVSMGQESESSSIDVPALTAGERREVTLELRTKSDVILFGVLIDGETAKPVPDGALFVEQGGIRISRGRVPGAAPPRPSQETDSLSVRADSQGRFELHGRSWNRQFVRASAPGYPRTMFALAPGHSDAAHPLEVRLWRGASVEVLVKNSAGGPIADALVELSTESYQLSQESGLNDFYMGESPYWSGRTDSGGTAVLGELVPRVPLKLVCSVRGAQPREEAQPAVLAPGERRTIEIRSGTGGSILGQVIDEQGQPLAKRKIWRVVNEWAEAAEPVIFRGYEKPAATTQTDEQGRFRFEDVAIGQWSVGLAPPDRQKREASEFPAYAETVELKTSDAVVELTLRVQANLYLRGNVIDPAGKPVPRCNVSASQKGSHMYPNANSDAAGAFALGPLPFGTWSVEARGFGSGFAPALSVTAEAGSESIVLQMRVGASISGRLVGGNPGEAIECEMTIANIDSAFAEWSMTTSHGDRFEFKGLLAGSYVVTAHDRAGRIGHTPAIHLESGQVEDSREIQLAPGAKLQLRYEGPNKYCSCTLLSGGMPVAIEQAYPSKLVEIVVPAGSIEIQWGAAGSLKTTSVVVAAGEVKEVVIDDKP